MTKYRLDRDPDSGKPCMVSDPNGIYYSTGEVDREVAQKVNLLEFAIFALKKEVCQWKGTVAERDDLIRRMAEAIRENWEDMWRVIGIDELYAEAEAILGPARNPHVGFGLIEIQPFPEPMPRKTHLEGEWGDAAGTKCVHADAEGICKVWSDEEVRQPCVEGPCPDMKFEYGNAIEFNDKIDLYAVDQNIENWRKELHERAAGTNDGGTVPNGDGAGAGPACRQGEERSPE